MDHQPSTRPVRFFALQQAVRLASSLELPGSGDAAATETIALARRFEGYLLGGRMEKQKEMSRA